MSAARLALIDDQEDVRKALAEMLGVFGYKVDTFASADAFLEGAGAARPGCVISDVRMPGLDGIGLVRKVAASPLNAPVILISGHADVPMAVEALKAGAFDFIEKPVDDVKLVASINRALARSAEQQDIARNTDELNARFERLTPREAEVFDLVTRGLTNYAVASELGISVRTVESYRAQIMEKMQADGLAMLVRQAIRLGRLAA
jgi:two-component system response regulator FixJ